MSQAAKGRSRASRNMRYESLPSDLVKEIMSRVPGKSLARFRSVSKQFKSLISDPCFRRLHHSRLRDFLFAISIHDNPLPNPRIDFKAFFHDGDHKKLYNFNVTNKANILVHKFTVASDCREFRMLSSHDQLLCFVYRTGIYLFDPMDKELKYLHHCPWSPVYFKEYSFECLVSFGFIDATMQYKVVKWPQDLDEKCTRRLPSGLVTTWKKVKLMFDVLNIDIEEDGCLKVSPWRSVQAPCPYLLQLSSQVLVNGFIYWTTSDFQIVSFSLHDETFSTVNPKPPCFRLDTQGSPKPPRFTLSGIRRNLWMVDYDNSSQIMEIWKMDESLDGGWGKIHKIEVGGIHPNTYNDRVNMLDIQPHQVLFKLTSSRLIRYNANSNTLHQNNEGMSTDYQLCHSTDGLLSLHNL